MQKLIYSPLCGGIVEIKSYRPAQNRHHAKSLHCVQKTRPFVILMVKNNKLAPFIIGFRVLHLIFHMFWLKTWTLLPKVQSDLVKTFQLLNYNRFLWTYTKIRIGMWIMFWWFIGSLYACDVCDVSLLVPFEFEDK